MSTLAKPKIRRAAPPFIRTTPENSSRGAALSTTVRVSRGDAGDRSMTFRALSAFAAGGGQSQHAVPSGQASRTCDSQIARRDRRHRFDKVELEGERPGEIVHGVRCLDIDDVLGLAVEQSDAQDQVHRWPAVSQAPA